MPDLARSAAAFGLFRVMLAGCRLGGTEALLRGQGPFTAFFVPDEAFGPETAGLDAEGWSLLARLHLVRGLWPAFALAEHPSVMSCAGLPLGLLLTDRLYVGGVEVVQADIRCDNGILHVLAAPLAATPLDDLAGTRGL